MLRLLIKQNVAEYMGAYTRPPFSLWGDGRTLLEGLHDAFAPFQVSLKDFRVDGTPEDPSSQTVKVYLGLSGQYRFRFDRIEATITNGTADELRLLPGILHRGSAWLREVVQGFTFKSHLFSYGAHCSIAEGSSETFLSSLHTPQLAALGTPRGSGIIFHAEDARRSWRVQLTVDHSLLVDNGIFLQFAVLVSQDQLDYQEFVSEAEIMLRESLGVLGLALES